MSQPDSSRCVAKEWRKVWQLTLFSTPAASAARRSSACSMSSEAWWRRTSSVRGSFESFAAGKTHCQTHSAAAAGYLRPERVGQVDPPGAGRQVLLVEQADAREVAAERLDQRHRQRGAPVLLPLAGADGDLVVAEVEVLDPQADALHHPQPRAVEERDHQAVGAAGVGEDAPRLLAGEDDGDARGAPGPLNALDVGQLDLEDLAVEEEERAERLVLGRSGYLPVRREMREELADLIRAHLRGVALAVEEDEALDPVDVGALRADAIMPEPQGSPDLLEER